jgi:hypothetical protein
MVFLQIADGVDDVTWMYQLRAGHYSLWMQTSIKDPSLASKVAAIEKNSALGAKESRTLVKDAIERSYTGAI